MVAAISSRTESGSVPLSNALSNVYANNRSQTRISSLEKVQGSFPALSFLLSTGIDARKRESLHDREEKDGNGVVPIFRHVHPFLRIVSPCDAPHVRHPSLHLLWVILEDFRTSHESDDGRNLT